MLKALGIYDNILIFHSKNFGIKSNDNYKNSAQTHCKTTETDHGNAERHVPQDFLTNP